MNTQQFFDAIYPSDGVVLIAVKRGNKMGHYGFDDTANAAKFALAADAKGFTVYHACSTYKRKPYLNEEGKQVHRTKSNYKSTKCFWVDIDCGADKAQSGAGYATKREALTALVAFCKDKSLPMPFPVNSGYGVHAYWPLVEAIDYEQWLPLAKVLKKAMSDYGLLADPTRTADFASLLRPVGTYNRKHETPKEVTCNALGTLIPNASMVSAIKALDPSAFIELPAGVKGFQFDDAKTTYPARTYDINQIAEKCAVVRQVRDTQGDAEYEVWRRVIGLIKFAGEPLETAIKWSEKRRETGHTQCDTEVKYNTWCDAPPRCDGIESNATNVCKGMCEKCPFKGKVNTPLSLGVVAPPPEPQTISDVKTAENTQPISLQIPPMPPGFEWDGEYMVQHCVDAKGVPFVRRFCQSIIYLTDRLCDEDGVFSANGRRIYFDSHKVAHTQRIVVPCSAIAVGGADLLRELGKQEVITTCSKDAGVAMGAYLKDSLHRLQTDTGIVNTYNSFGWQANGGFLIGNRMYTPDGKMTEVLLSGRAASKAKAFPTPCGKLEDYATNVNWIYAREGMELFQYLICSLWAAPLADLCSTEYHGLPCAVTGSESGKGKTTAANVGIYAYGKATEDLTISGAVGATMNGLGSSLGVFKSLPVLFDEITNKSTKDLSELCYTIPNGVEKQRMVNTSQGVQFANRAMWRTHVAFTGNTNISQILSKRGNTEAEAMRVFEINVDNYNIPELDPLAVSCAVDKIAQCGGVAGEAIVKYVVQHRKELSEEILATLQSLPRTGARADKRYRFYRYHIACTLVMARIANALGICSFNRERLRKFALNALDDLCTAVAEANALTSDAAYAQMISDLSPRIAVTPTYVPKPNSAPFHVQLGSQGGLVGRSIIGTGDNTDPVHNNRLYLAVRAITNWCTENRVPKTKIASYLAGKGALVAKDMLFTLSKGTTAESTKCKCWAIDKSKLEA